MRMRGHQLRTRLVAYERTDTKDVTGERVYSFVEVAKAYAEIQQRRPSYDENDGFPSTTKPAIIRVRKTNNMLARNAGDVFVHPETDRMFTIQGQPTIDFDKYAYLEFDTQVVTLAANQLSFGSELAVTYDGADMAATIGINETGFALTSTTEGAQTVTFSVDKTIREVQDAINALTGWTAALDLGQLGNELSTTFLQTGPTVVMQNETARFARGAVGASVATTSMVVTYTGADMAATIAVSTTAFALTSATEGAQSITWADNPTVQNVEDAINALIGWTAVLDAGQTTTDASSTFDATLPRVIAQNESMTFTRQ